MEYKDKVAVVTGGAHGIGKCIAEEFRKREASVAVIDVREGDHFVGDISKKEVLEAFADEVIGKYGKVDFIINNALAVTLRGKARVNSISPGWIDTDYKEYYGPDAIQQPAGRVGNPMDIANMVLYLCSDKAGFITGENICIDGGMTRQMIYHGDHGWSLKL